MKSPSLGNSMFRRYYNLALAGMWIVLGIVMIAPEETLPARFRQIFVVRFGLMGGLLAFTIAAYNFARWWSIQSLRNLRNELPIRKSLSHEQAARDIQPNPDFDFLSSDRDQSQLTPRTDKR